MTITLENQKKHQAESILAIASEFTKMATQGGHGIRYVSGQNLTVTSKPNERFDGYDQNPVKDYNDCTVEIQSSFFNELTVREIFSNAGVEI